MQGRRNICPVNDIDPTRLFKCRVLVVEDDPLVLETTAAIVRSFGFSVRTAEDGFVALKILREVLPDIILCDLRMPAMSGFELLSIVRRRFPHIPTIAISGEYILATMPLGLLVDHFFQKGGYTPEQLLAKMKELIADSPIRPHLGKADRVPLWIPRKDADYVVVTCPECLRSSSIADDAVAADVHETDCVACGAQIRYLVDSSVLNALGHKKKILPSSGSLAETGT